MNTNIIADIDALKVELATLMEEMGERAKTQLGIEPSADYSLIKDELSSAEYIVPVIGEAKLGKSSLLNGIIGSEILPVNLDVATSQAIKVSVATEPKYAIVYVDNSILYIEEDDIVKVSSQAEIDKEGLETRFNKKEITWIEIDYPTKFLPSYISIVDTPGLGALYAGHSKITNRILPLAKAVIFVLGSERPINSDEIKTLHKVVSYTKEIVFVQTKIDLVSDWSENLEQNIKIISREFSDVLKGQVEIWPISNSFLGKASTANENRSKKYLEKSRFLEMKFHLEYVLLEKFGWDVIIAGTSFGDELVTKAEKSLAKSVLSLSDNSGSESQKIIKENKQKIRKLEDEWGKKGYKRKKHVNKLAKYANGLERDFSQIFSERGSIYLKMRNEIDELYNEEGVKAYGEEVLDRVEYLFESNFLEYDDLLKTRLKDELVKIYSDDLFIQNNQRADEIAEKIQSQVNAVVNSNKRNREPSFFARVGKVLGDVFGWLFLPFFKIRKFFSNLGARDNRLERNKTQLTASVKKVLSTIRKEIDSTDYRGGREASHQSQYFGTFPAELERIIEAKYVETKLELEIENKVHKKYLENEIRKNKEEAIQINKRKKEWSDIRIKLTNIEGSADDLRKKFKQRQYD